MSLESTRIDITAKLRQGKFPSVCHPEPVEGSLLAIPGIVLRDGRARPPGAQHHTKLRFHPSAFIPHSFPGERPPTKPAEFIEVKPPGKAEDGVRQALKPSASETPRRRRARRANAVRQYAFHTGVPFIVLTDGRTWSFYLPAEQGSYDDRRVYKLDLYERPPTEAADILRRYLAHERVVSGEALEAARKEYRSRNRRTQACAAIPEAWRELVEKPSPRDAAVPFLPQRNEEIVDMLASAVESKAGVCPEDNDVAEFLAALGKPVMVETASSKSPVKPGPRNGGPRSIVAASSARAGKLILRDKAYDYHNARDRTVLFR